MRVIKRIGGELHPLSRACPACRRWWPVITVYTSHSCWESVACTSTGCARPSPGFFRSSPSPSVCRNKKRTVGGAATRPIPSSILLLRVSSRASGPPRTQRWFPWQPHATGSGLRLEHSGRCSSASARAQSPREAERPRGAGRGQPVSKPRG